MGTNDSAGDWGNVPSEWLQILLQIPERGGGIVCSSWGGVDEEKRKLRFDSAFSGG